MPESNYAYNTFHFKNNISLINVMLVKLSVMSKRLFE